MQTKILLAAVGLLGLAACGGGGGGGGSSAQPTATPQPDPTPTPTLAPTPPLGELSLSGRLRIAEGTHVDADVANPQAPYAANDQPDLAQFIPNFARVGGYVRTQEVVNQLRCTVDDTTLSRDECDFYRITLLAGQAVNLYIANVEQADLDLYLFDENENLLAQSISPDGNIESVEVTADGDYLLLVNAYDGGSSYVLEVGNRIAAQHAMRSQLEIIPDSVVLAFDDSGLKKAQLEPKARGAALGLEHTGGEAGRSLRYALPAGGTKSASPWYSFDPELQARNQTLQAIKALAKRGDVLYAEPELRLQVALEPNDEFYRFQWHYPLINLPLAWDVSVGSSTVIVSVIDTGTLIAHPDLAPNLDPNDPNGVDFISDLATARDGNGRDNDGNDVGDGANPDGSASFHGTHVAGTIAATTDNDIGVSGVCWNCRIMTVRALGFQGGSSFDVEQGIRYSAGLSNDSGALPAQRADIINLSLGGGGFLQSVQNTFNEVRNAGVIVIAAAGNDGSNNFFYPASYDNVLSVASVGPDRNRAGYSQFNSRVDLAAPGGNAALGPGSLVLSTYGRGSGGNDVILTLGELQGTSMAAPHVAGVVGLMKSIYPELSPAQLELAIASGRIVDDRGAQGRDDLYGAGIINALKAVQYAQELATGTAPEAVPVLVSSPTQIDFGRSGTQRELILENAGTGTLEVTGVSLESSSPWLSIGEPQTLESGHQSYPVSIDRAGLDAGIYQDALLFSSNANALRVPVRMQVSAVGAESTDDAGFHYFLLIDVNAPPEEPTPYQYSVGATEGEYPVSFSNIPAGEYYLVAGSDMDDDLLICDEGEACAIFPQSNLLETFVLEADRNDVEFVTGFDISLQANQSTLGVAGRDWRLPRQGFPVRPTR